MLSTLGKNFSRRHFKIFHYFFQKTGFDISCKLFGDNLHEISKLFSGKNRKNIDLSSAELVQRVVTVKLSVLLEGLIQYP